MLVEWEEPLFSDNSHGQVNVTQSHRPPAAFSVGTTHVHYTATDRYGNNATCVIDIVVQGLDHNCFIAMTGDIVLITYLLFYLLITRRPLLWKTEKTWNMSRN